MAEFGSGVLGGETPVDGGCRRVAVPLIAADVPVQRPLVGVPSLRQARANTLNSISAVFSQLPCLGVWCPASTIVAEKSSIGFAGSPPLPAPVAGLHQCGSWGRQTRG